ncbi:MarR family transcriptional regulator [Mumia sp. zg.B17]|uniref:GbsR/MarR family transcriptional regulator n=1 Tax=unclassified Mumia TaxID=2621872 RepID=UPI001C6E7034|nr:MULTISPECIES: helix-turn-helix domain-containing protein [unclassified Mumia]MBW9207762.1 MarR family transcriptional regulator [Mumia sp. zg.B17]MBW9209892.1 MarR family transcriptional regulator [Mumia sp. zg.B21]
MANDTLTDFVDQFSTILRDSGVPPMPARTFAYVLGLGRPSYTAADLAETTGASPAAISGAVTYLIGVGMLERHGGADRRHHYRLPPGDLWASMIRRREAILVRRYEALAQAATDLGGRHDEHGAPLELGAMLFSFMAEDVPAMLARWEAYRDARLDELNHPPAR